MSRTSRLRVAVVALVVGAGLSLGMQGTAGAAGVLIRVQVPTTGAGSFGGLVFSHPIQGAALDLNSDTVYDLPGLRLEVQVVTPCRDCPAR